MIILSTSIVKVSSVSKYALNMMLRLVLVVQMRLGVVGAGLLRALRRGRVGRHVAAGARLQGVQRARLRALRLLRRIRLGHARSQTAHSTHTAQVCRILIRVLLD